MGAADLYRITRDPRHLQLANDVIEMRGAFQGGSDHNQDRVPLRDEKEVVGHSVFYSYLFAGAADAYMETGDPALLSALNRLWDDLVEHKLYITGGTCAYYRGVTFRNGNVWRSDDVREAVGPKYYLPKWSYNETCGQVGAFLWNWRMLAITGEARFGDFMEREMFNGFLPAIGVEGDSFLYTNPMRWLGDEQVLMSSDSRARHLPGKGHGTCCPSNVLRALAEMQGYFYSTSGDDLWVHHYGGNSFDNDAWSVTQETNYPWDGDIKIKVRKAPAGGTVNLRIPEWAAGGPVRVDGRELSLTGSQYFAVTRPWSGNDVITVELPMKVRLMRGHRKVDATHGQTAVVRGPLVYCLESPDLPGDVDISEIILPRGIKLEPKTEPGLLGGVVTLNGKALRLPQDNSRLYNEMTSAEPAQIDIKLIPYYSWNNRGVSKMTVWLPVDW
ncbi:MAG: hypothetical protein GY953_28055 [bacterium]|nr:hypothetical protein [bacterium]